MMVWSAIASAVLALGAGMACTVAVADSCPSPGNEAEHMQEGRTVRAMLLAGKFDELERHWEAVRDPAKVLASGIPRRAGFVTSARVRCPGEGADRAERMQRQITAWGKAKRNSTIQPIFAANHALHEAWAIRGGAYAAKTAQESLQEFRQRALAVIRDTDAIRGAARSDPLWYEVRLEANLAAGVAEPEHRRVLRELAAAHPTDYRTLAVGARYYLPRWHGSREEITDVVELIVKALPESERDQAYAVAWWRIGIDKHTFYSQGDGADWSRFKRGYLERLKRYPVPSNLNAYGYFACEAQDFFALRKALKLIDGKPMLSLWGGKDNHDFCIRVATPPPPIRDPKERHGPWYQQTTQGTEQGAYIYGEKVGEWTYRDARGMPIKEETHPTASEVIDRRTDAEVLDYPVAKGSPR